MKTKTLYLYGRLAQLFGRKHSLAVNSVAEAVRAMEANHPGFYDALKNKQYGQWHVLRSRNVDGTQLSVRDIALKGQEMGMKDVPEAELKMHMDFDDIHITPVVRGSKNAGWISIVVGVILIIVGIIFIATGHPEIGVPLIVAGIGMIIGGVVQLLTPAPKNPDYSQGEQPEERPSYLFDGPTNTTAQGLSIPLIYGRMHAGSIVVSAGLQVEDV